MEGSPSPSKRRPNLCARIHVGAEEIAHWSEAPAVDLSRLGQETPAGPPVVPPADAADEAPTEEPTEAELQDGDGGSFAFGPERAAGLGLLSLFFLFA